MPLTTPTPEFKMASALLSCLQEQFLTDIPEYPTPGRFELRANESPITDDMDPVTQEDLCCSGLGWVRIGNGIPTDSFPEPSGVLKGCGCFPTGWEVELEVGLLRCYVPGGQASMATEEQQTVNFIQDTIALNVLKLALCCFGNWLCKNHPARAWQIQGITINGPRGNCIDRTANIIVGAPKCC